MSRSADDAGEAVAGATSRADHDVHPGANPASHGAKPTTNAEPTGRAPGARRPPRRRGRATLETSAGGVVYRVQNGQAMFLLIRDSYRNWGFPKGHLETDELPAAAALREVREETGLDALHLDGEIEVIDWFFRFRGKLVHKVCHFYLMRTDSANTKPQRAEGITACRWATFDDATRLVSYTNARDVLRRAHAMVLVGGAVTPPHVDTSSA